VGLNGQVALVTGAGRGIGRSISLALAAAGASVAVNDIDEKSSHAVADEIMAADGDSVPIPADVTDEEGVRVMVEQVVEAWKSLDILVNNAGVCPTGPLIESSAKQWDLVFSINCKGVFLCTRAALAHMIPRRHGAIVSVASNAGKTAEPFLVPYSASKFAVVGFTQGLARELAPYRIRVNCVCPVMCETDMMEDLAQQYTRWYGGTPEEQRNSFHAEIPWGRMARPDDVAHAVLFLVDPRSEFITGQALNVSGGLEMH
jgi:meso-butanediol dehydrogenase / (S,S)-butanediol dehydrogenase / diacetyl reductase